MDKASQQDLVTEVLEIEAQSKSFGFYWENISQILEQIISECHEVGEAYVAKNYTHCEEEIGDLIHAAISLAYYCGYDPHQALQVSFDKYKARFEHVKQLAAKDGLKDLKNQPMSVLMGYWKKAKEYLWQNQQKE